MFFNLASLAVKTCAQDMLQSYVYGSKIWGQSDYKIQPTVCNCNI